MNPGIKIYIGLITVIAALAIALAYQLIPHVPADYVWAAISFSALGLLSELLAYEKFGRKQAGSMAFLPFIAAIILAPTWITVVCITGATLISQLVHRKGIAKCLFNASQVALSAASCTIVYIVLGGKPLLVDRDIDLIAYLFGALLYTVVNSLAVNGIFVINEGKSLSSLYSEVQWSTLVYDILALPFVYVFAWFYLSFGWIGAVALTIPLLGVRELYKKNWLLQQTNQELLELMVAAIEARDTYTSGHSRRVANNARVIAQALGLRAKEVERIATAALLHDVGKIHEIFGPILSKPGRLTPEEHAIMQTHAAKSAELVSKVSALADLVEPIKHHHENWDGTGYPAKLSGENIPLTARIIMFADTIDAMTTDRPYRAAMTPAAVKAELIRCRSKQFDPTICDTLIGSPMFDILFESTSQQQSTRQNAMVQLGATPKLSST